MSLAVGQNYMLRINVMTTATPRTELHQTTLEPTLKVLSEHFDVRLYITLDDVLDEDSFKESIEYIETLPTRQTHLVPSKTGSFKLVTKKLYESISPDEEDIFFWLEDDWILMKPDLFVDELKKFPETDYDFIVTTIYDQIGGNPLVFRKRFFDEMKEYYLQNEKPMDPELVLWHIEKKIWGGKHQSNWLLVKNVFVDAGKEWRLARGIKKQNKRSDVMTTWIT